MVILLPSMLRPLRTLDVRLTPYISLMSYDYLEYMTVTPGRRGKDMGVYNLEDGSIKEQGALL
jgi:hypothetical protein